mgnify:CR=1 FL=1
MSDLHATERIIGGLIVVGVASLLSWNHSQGGDPGMFGMVLTGVIVSGGLWATLGLAELIFGPLRDGRRQASDHPAP